MENPTTGESGKGYTNVVITRPMEERHLETIRKVSSAASVSYNPCGAPGDPIPDLARAEVILGYYFSFGLEQAPSLRWIHFCSAGVDYLRDKPVWASEVTITNSHIYAVPIGEYVFASILGLSRRLPDIRREFQEERSWRPDAWSHFGARSRDLQGSTIGIIGFGEVGRRVAALARAFGMEVVATDIAIERPSSESGIRLLPKDQLDTLLASSDYVVLSVPVSPLTRGLIGEEELHQMKPTAFLVNVARGEVVDEPALIKALKEGWIAGAGLDVFSTEPLPSDSELFELPNVILSPHIAGASSRGSDRLAEEFADNLRRYIAQQPLRNVVNRSLGF